MMLKLEARKKRHKNYSQNIEAIVMNALQLKEKFIQAFLSASKSQNYQSGNLFLVASECTFANLSKVSSYNEIWPAPDYSNPKLDSADGVMQYLHKIGLDYQVRTKN